MNNRYSGFTIEDSSFTKEGRAKDFRVDFRLVSPKTFYRHAKGGAGRDIAMQVTLQEYTERRLANEIKDLTYSGGADLTVEKAGLKALRAAKAKAKAKAKAAVKSH